MMNIRKGLVAYYPLNGNAQDESGNDNHGVVNNAKTTKDRFGNSNSAFCFNGKESHIEIPSHQTLDIHRSLTLSAWVKPHTIQRRCTGVVSRGRSHAGTGYRLGLGSKNQGQLGLNGGRVVGLFGSFTAGVSSKPLKPKEWVHIAGTWKVPIMRIYVNGKLENSNLSEAYRHLSHSKEVLCIGRETPGLHDRYFDGDIDEVRVYNRELSAEEIVLLFNFRGRSDALEDLKERIHFIFSGVGKFHYDEKIRFECILRMRNLEISNIPKIFLRMN